MTTKTIPAAYLDEWRADIARFYNGEEIFLPIPGFAGYLVSDFGRVISNLRKTPRFLVPLRHRQGYSLQNLVASSGKQKMDVLHRLVMLAHRGPAPVSLTGRPWSACHANGVEWDCRLSNLRYDTQAGNMADKLVHGTSTRKCDSLQPVTADIVRDILTDHSMTAKELAAWHDLSPRIVSTIRNGQAYRHFCPELPRRNKVTARKAV